MYVMYEAMKGYFGNEFWLDHVRLRPGVRGWTSSCKRWPRKKGKLRIIFILKKKMKKKKHRGPGKKFSAQ